MLTPRLIESALSEYGTGCERIFVAYSGGVDSHVLLHLCAGQASIRERVTAVHVHHGLQPEAELWARYAERVAGELGVDFVLCRVDARPHSGESPEEAARNARYEALKALMPPASALLVAQHQDDQLETVLLQLLRGTGLLGLSGMPPCLPFGQGVLLRPFLKVAKRRIDDYAAAHGLYWVEDPSNRDEAYDRNFLRNEILPLLRRRWPACAETVARAAEHCGEAHAVLSEVGEEAFASVYRREDNTLSLSRLTAFDDARRLLIIRRWFRQMDLKMPSRAFIDELQQAVIAAAPGCDPVLSGQGRQIRRFRDRLYCIEPDDGKRLPEYVWRKEADVLALGEQLAIACVPADDGIPEAVWRRANVVVKFRGGGEKIALPGRKGRHPLKNLYQEAGIPPWRREALPLVYLDGSLAAVADLWISADFYHAESGACVRFNLRRG